LKKKFVSILVGMIEPFLQNLNQNGQKIKALFKNFSKLSMLKTQSWRKRK
jgi:hypothetical protein